MNPAGAPTGLTQLRGLHLPADSGSGAQGEVVLAIALGFVAALLVGLVRVIRARTTNSVRASALRGLAETRGLHSDARLIAQARLLRRVTRTLAGDEAASAEGRDWAVVLDRLFTTDFFGKGAGATVTEGLYRRPSPADLDLIDAELGRLFTRIKA